jgi:hypothetical protein
MHFQNFDEVASTIVELQCSGGTDAHSAAELVCEAVEN